MFDSSHCRPSTRPLSSRESVHERSSESHVSNLPHLVLTCFDQHFFHMLGSIISVNFPSGPSVPWDSRSSLPTICPWFGAWQPRKSCMSFQMKIHWLRESLGHKSLHQKFTGFTKVDFLLRFKSCLRSWTQAPGEGVLGEELFEKASSISTLSIT